MKYRRKSQKVQAVQFFSGDGPNTIAECLSLTGSRGKVSEHYGEEAVFQVENRVFDEYLLVYDGEWLVRDSYSVYYKYTDAVFKTLYEEL